MTRTLLLWTVSRHLLWRSGIVVLGSAAVTEPTGSPGTLEPGAARGLRSEVLAGVTSGSVAVALSGALASGHGSGQR
jgi:hypothetical protein